MDERCGGAEELKVSEGNRFVVAFHELAAGEFPKAARGHVVEARRSSLRSMYRSGSHSWQRSATGCLVCILAGPTDAPGDVEKHDARQDEVAGMAPAAINDQMGQAVVTTGCLAVHLETGFGLRRWLQRLVAGSGRFQSRASDPPHPPWRWGQSRTPAGRKHNGEKTTHRIDSC